MNKSKYQSLLKDYLIIAIARFHIISRFEVTISERIPVVINIDHFLNKLKLLFLQDGRLLYFIVNSRNVELTLLNLYLIDIYLSGISYHRQRIVWPVI